MTTSPADRRELQHLHVLQSRYPVSIQNKLVFLQIALGEGIASKKALCTLSKG